AVRSCSRETVRSAAAQTRAEMAKRAVIDMGATRQGATSWEASLAGRARERAGREIAEIMALAARRDLISFSGGFPDPSLIDRDALLTIQRELGASDDLDPFRYAPTEGLRGLREYVAERVARVEGARVDEDTLIVTSGGMEAIQLLATIFVEPGDPIVIEAPTYLGAQLGLASNGARLVAIDVDDEGMDVHALAGELSRGLRPKFVYTNPDHQNPAGV